MRKCKSCGAPITKSICEYCGEDNSQNDIIEHNGYYTIPINGKRIKCHISDIKMDDCITTGRNIDGTINMHKERIYTITLIGS